MLKNYLKIALRNLLKHKGYSLINILGLAVGMASGILILLYVHDELSYDKHHEKANQIYRVTREWFNSDGSSSLHLGHVAPPIGPLLKNDFPDILQMARIADGNEPLLLYQDRVFQEERFYFADPNIFEIFTLPLLKGDAKNALVDPNGVVLTPAMAQKFFGDEEPLGKVLNFNNQADLKVTGVVKDFNYESLHQPITPIVMLIAPQSFNSVSVKIRAERPDDMAATLEFLKQKWQEYRPNFPFQYSFIDERYEQLYQSEHRLGQIFGAFSLLAVFIACLGLFGLASYTAEQRTKEIGVRKVLGASVGNIVLLLSKEFTRLVIFATLVSWPLAYFAMSRWLQEFAYRINLNHQSGTFILAAVLAFAIALVTVSFQSIKAAASNPIKALRYE